MDFWQYIASLELAPSDWLLFASALPIAWFCIVYGLFTKWFEDPFGWVLISGALGLLGVIVSVIFAVFAGARIDEPIRFALYGAIFISWVGKDIVLHRERKRGKLAKREIRPHTGPVPTRKEQA